MLRKFLSFALCLMPQLAPAKGKPEPKPLPADLVITEARIYTLDPAEPQVAALAIRDAKIIARGSRESIERWRGPQTRVIDVNGRFVYPGFHEGHGHLLGLGQSLVRIDLSGFKSVKEISRRLEEYRANAPSSQGWILGRGWDQNLWEQKEFPSHADLDPLFPDRPIALTRVDGHALWVNAAALKLAGITATTSDPSGGRILRDAKGEASGILLDKAMDLVQSKIPPLSDAERVDAMRVAFALCARLGITSFHDAGVDAATMAVYERLAAEKTLPLRINAMLAGNDEALLDRYLAKGPELRKDGYLQVRSVKLMADGALGSRGAALLQPYADKHEESGIEILSEDAIYKASKRFADSGFQTATHAIGDRSNRSVLNAYERVLKEATRKGKRPDLRLRIEHAQIVDPQDIPRFGQLGIIASMQPIHLTSDAPWVPSRIGQARMDAEAYVWQKLLKSGARLVGGSDAPVEDPNPLLGLYAAVTRQDREGKPLEAWAADQRLSMDEALALYTTGAAYAAFVEKRSGSLTPGKDADLVVLEEDLFANPKQPQAILKNSVYLTMVGGAIRYQKPGT